MSVTNVDTFRAVLTALMEAAREGAGTKRLRARGKLPSEAAVLRHVGVFQSSWSRAKQYGQLPTPVFKSVSALIDKADKKRELEERWYRLKDCAENKIVDEDIDIEALLHVDTLDEKYEFQAHNIEWIRLAANLLERHGLETNLIRFSQPELEKLYWRIRRERGESAGLVAAFILTNAVFASFRDGRMTSSEPFIAMSCCLVNVASVTRSQKMLSHAASLLRGETGDFARWLRADASANFHQQRLATDPIGEMKEVKEKFRMVHVAAKRIISEKLVSAFPALNNGISGTIFNFANTELRQAHSALDFKKIVDNTNSELHDDDIRLGRTGTEFKLGSGEMYSCELFIRHHNAGGFRLRSFTEHDPGLAQAEVDKVFQLHGFQNVPLYVRVSLLESRSTSMYLQHDLGGFDENEQRLTADLELLGDAHRKERSRGVMEAQRRRLERERR